MDNSKLVYFLIVKYLGSDTFQALILNFKSV